MFDVGGKPDWICLLLHWHVFLHICRVGLCDPSSSDFLDFPGGTCRPNTNYQIAHDSGHLSYGSFRPILLKKSDFQIA